MGLTPQRPTATRKINRGTHRAGHVSPESRFGPEGVLSYADIDQRAAIREIRRTEPDAEPPTVRVPAPGNDQTERRA